MKRYSPTLEPFSWEDGAEGHELDVRPVMREDPGGDWMLASDVQLEVGRLTSALRDMLSTVRASTKAGVAAMQRAKQTLEQIDHGDEPGDIGVVGTPADGGND